MAVKVNRPSLLDHQDDLPARAPARGGHAGGKPRTWAQVKLVGALVCIAVAGVVTYFTLSGQVDVGAESRRRTLIDSQTLEVFADFPISEGDRFPYENPKTKARTLFPVERCYWTRDGKAKVDPTYVLLNEYADKPGGTTCPDCGKKVVGHNPPPPASLMAQAAKDAVR